MYLTVLNTTVQRVEQSTVVGFELYLACEIDCGQHIHHETRYTINTLKYPKS